MKVKATLKLNTLKALNELFSAPGKQASWKEIMAAVIATGEPVKNWLHVRGILQEDINAGLLSRLPDASREIYIRVK